MPNTITIAEIKRRGMAAIEEGLRHGPVHIVKRNQHAAVVLSEDDYARLTGSGSPAGHGLTAVQWLLAHPGNGERDKEQIDADLRTERAW